MSDRDPGIYSQETALYRDRRWAWQINLGFQDRAGVIAAYLMAGDGELALIETGPSSCLANVRAGIAQTGHDISELTHALVTHIHLDHAGAAGPLARDNPNLRVYVHPFGAPHMIDPSKLVASATRIYGDQMEPLWGEFAADRRGPGPCPARRRADQGGGSADPGGLHAGSRPSPCCVCRSCRPDRVHWRCRRGAHAGHGLRLPADSAAGSRSRQMVGEYRPAAGLRSRPALPDALRRVPGCRSAPGRLGPNLDEFLRSGPRRSMPARSPTS